MIGLKIETKVKNKAKSLIIDTMDELQRQIIELSHKIDNLYDVVEQIKGQVTYSNQEHYQSPKTLANVSMMRTSSPSVSSRVSPVIEQHKDVLVDNNSWHHESSSVAENSLSCDLQVRRLTAQLTAAYNRIAALEEQLLATRIH
jgi:predicted  nucleic acid-binding Zn-ribbon protein